MPSEALSQAEIDALLGGGRKTAAVPARPVQAEFQLYDFRRPNRVSKDRLRTLEAMYERFAKALEAWVIGRVRRQVDIRLQGIEQFSFGEFVLSLPTPCAAFGFDIRNAPGPKGVIDVGSDFAYFLVDRFFGGSGQPSTMNRALTPIERLTVRTVVERMVSLLAEVWQDHVELDLEITSFESFPDMVQVASREDPVLVASVEVSADGKTSLLLLCLPFSVLDKFFTSGDRKRVHDMTGSERERRATRELTELSVRATHVEVSARLPVFEVPLRQLLGMPVGHVLETGVPANATLDVLVGGQVRYRAAPGRIGQKLAVRVLDPVDMDPGASSSSLS